MPVDAQAAVRRGASAAAHGGQRCVRQGDAARPVRRRWAARRRRGRGDGNKRGGPRRPRAPAAAVDLQLGQIGALTATGRTPPCTRPELLPHRHVGAPPAAARPAGATPAATPLPALGRNSTAICHSLSSSARAEPPAGHRCAAVDAPGRSSGSHPGAVTPAGHVASSSRDVRAARAAARPDGGGSERTSDLAGGQS